MVECVNPLGYDALIETIVRDDGRIELITTAPAGDPVVLTTDNAATLRNQLSAAITTSLRDTRTRR